MRALLEGLAQRPGDVVLVYRAHRGRRRCSGTSWTRWRAERGARVVTVLGTAHPRAAQLAAGVGASTSTTSRRCVHLVPDVAERDVYLCGTAQWMEHARAAAVRAGCTTGPDPRGEVRLVRRIAMWTARHRDRLVLLFSYHTSTSSRFAPSQAAVAGRDATDDAPDLPESGTFDGDPVVTRFGVVQVRITVADGRIASVEALQAAEPGPPRLLINERAVPILNAEAVEAQSAQVDLVSGATVTSQGYIQSLQSAIDRRCCMSRRAWVEQVMGMPVSIHLRGPQVRGPRGGAGRRRRIRRAGPARRPLQHLYRHRVAAEPAPARGPGRRVGRAVVRGGRGAVRDAGRSAPVGRSPPGCRTMPASSASTRPAWSRAGPSTALPAS